MDRFNEVKSLPIELEQYLCHLFDTGLPSEIHNKINLTKTLNKQFSKGV